MEENKGIPVVLIIGRTLVTIKYLFSKWLLILLIAFLFGLIGLLYAWLQKPIYVAEMSFVTENEAASRLGGYAGIAAQFGLDLGVGSNNVFEGENLIELLKSRNLVERTLLTPMDSNKSVLLIDEYIRFAKIKDGWDTDHLNNIQFSVDGVNHTRKTDSVLQLLSQQIISSNLEVFKKDKKLSLIIAKMKSENEMFSKRFIELLAINAIQYYTDYKSKKSRQNVEILQRQVDSVKRMLSGSISDVAIATDLNVNPARQSVRAPVQRRQVDVQVNGALYTELLKNLELSKLTLRKETPLIEIIDRPKYPLKKKKTGRLLASLAFAFIGGLMAIIFVLMRRWAIQNDLRSAVRIQVSNNE